MAGGTGPKMEKRDDSFEGIFKLVAQSQTNILLVHISGIDQLPSFFLNPSNLPFTIEC
jgi:hypothetical protein